MGIRKFQHFYSNPHLTEFSVNRTRMGARLLSITALSVGLLFFTVSGCSVNEHKNGTAENVHLHTPIGGLDVRTDSAAAIDTGLPVYPGAVETGDQGKSSGAADIHISFGKWQLHVKAVEYQSNDAEAKVIAFYKKAMASYGDVITCKDKMPVGEPVATRQGLTCANDHEYDVSMDTDASRKHVHLGTSNISGDIKLLAGSSENQHIIEFTPTSTGTKFSIVSVQMPHQGQTD